MIGFEELNNVNISAQDVIFPGKEYAIETMDKLIEAYTMYKDVFMGSEYIFKLSNGEFFEYSMLDKNIPSLLGIETKNLISEQYQDTIDTVLGLDSRSNKRIFEYFQRIIDRADEVIKNDSKENSKKILNYYRSMLKSIVFLGLPCFDKFDYGIINNISNEHLVNGYNSKYIYVHNNEELTPYFVISLRYDEQKGIYVPTTLLAMKHIGSFIDKQELVLPLDLIIKYCGSVSKIKSTPIEKIKLLSEYRDAINKYRTNTNVNLDGIELIKKR